MAAFTLTRVSEFESDCLSILARKHHILISETRTAPDFATTVSDCWLTDLRSCGLGQVTN